MNAIYHDRIYEYYKQWHRPGIMTALVMENFDRGFGGMIPSAALER